MQRAVVRAVMLRRGQRFQMGAQKFRVAYVNESRAHCVGVEKRSVTVNDRKTGGTRTFEAQSKVCIDISPNAAVELLDDGKAVR